MSKSRRQFLARTSLGLLGAAAAGPSKAQKPAELPLGAPPAFGTAPAVGPEVSPTTFVEAEKLVQVELSGTERAVAAGSWRTTMAALYERRTGPRKVGLEPALAPYSQWDPVLPGPKPRTGARPIYPDQERSGSIARKRRRHCLRPADAALTLDREAKAYLGTAHAPVP